MIVVIGEPVLVEVDTPPAVSVSVSVPPIPLVTVLYPETRTVTIENASIPDMYIPALPGPRGDTGVPGPQGPQGPQGLPGSGGPDGYTGSETFNQGVPSTIWRITHSLPFKPNVTVVDSAGHLVEGDVRYLSISDIEVEFASGFSGTAYLS
jgi:hypothetical protein